MFGMKEVQRPPAVLVAALDHDFDGIPNVAVGFDSCVPQIIESAQDVVVPKRREREAQPALVDDFVSSNRAEHAALEQIVFASLAGLSDGRRFAPCSRRRRSEEHTSELQSLAYLVCRLLLEQKNHPLPLPDP